MVLPAAVSANWHWKTKSTKPWAEQWFQSELSKCSTGDAGVRIVSVKEVEGDCEVGMRKSKVITIYDLKITTVFESSSGDDKITGTLTALEVSHDMEESDYQFEVSVDQSSADASKAKELARTSLANLCRPIFQRFPKEMVNVHGKDLLVDSANASPAGSGRSTPAPQAASSSASASTGASSTSKANKVTNTTTVKVESAFQITAEDLFELLTDGEKKVPMWTRNPAKISPQVGSEVSLFGGNITGKVTKVEKPNLIAMSWRAPTWEQGHHGELTMTLKQSSSDTTLSLRLEGVPLGKEEETERNLDVYYIRSLKQIGSGDIPSIPHASSVSRNRKRDRTPSRWDVFAARAGAALIPLLSFGLVATMIYAIYYGPTFEQ